ncbi:SARP family transcriptional regulator [Streptomyces sp. NE5-10]|uniref:AfsR/SARP family transcriptional regulator n=1 Tax=Streptomyces sp. NE5-10 TaxID=2759674 RepID=UPI00190889B0|nr:BTAD domain-containing putative transcriptional regulator [Streptomyces sp. NE5-10]GHJ95956.1 SARP family transcriptional regulator [Streptomyces sp. NE5-10]
MRFGVLGPVVVWDDDGVEVVVPEAKVRTLLALLLAHDGGTVAADRLVDVLWSTRLPANPSGALQARVSQLRRVLGKDRVVRRPPGYRLDARPEEVDASRFRALVAQAAAAPAPGDRAALLTEALGLWRGPAFADVADLGPVGPAAARLDEERLTAQEERARALLAVGGGAALAGELAGLVAAHPLRESLHALRLRALYAAGRQGEALAAYEELRGRLAEELGVDPGPELASLHTALLRHAPELAVRAPSSTPDTPDAPVAPLVPLVPPGPATPSTPSAPTAVEPLPSPLTPLIGRDALVSRVRRTLGASRQVTLTGPGGVGKTRVAVMAAQGAGTDAWLVEFAGVRAGTAADLAQVVAAALGLRDDARTTAPGAAPLSALGHLAGALRDRRGLLVLDNCEHVVDAAAELAARLLAAAPGVRVLATSQEPLGLGGETVVPVEPLAAPDAVRLFTERAAASAPDFPADPAAVGPEDRTAVEEICRRLDGIPLALELAATRVRALGVRELADRLGDRFRLLAGRRRGGPARQRTLRAVIDWSWELLSPPERVVLSRLAVFGEGGDLAAVTAVATGDGVTGGEVWELVGRLVDRSLVTVADGPYGPRYRLLESVAAYALERLAERAEADAVRERHLAHYLDLAERAESELRGPDQRARLDRLDAEAGHLRAALDTALSRSGDGARAARLARALAWWWLLRGRLTEARRSLRAVLDAYPDPFPERHELLLLHRAFALLTEGRDADGTPIPADACGRRARAGWLCAYGLFSAGAPEEAEAVNSRALERFEELGDAWGKAAALSLRARLALDRGDLAGLGRDGADSARVFRELGDRWGELQTVSALATLAEIRGAYEEAAGRQREGLRMARELGLTAEVSARLSGLGRLALLERDGDRARELHGQALAMAAEQGYAYGEIHARMGLALGARRSGDLAAAEHHLLLLRDRFAQASSPAGEHLRHAELGFLAELGGRHDEALGHHLRGLAVARTLAEPRALALSLEGLAGALAPHSPAEAAALLGAADAERRTVDAPLPTAERADVDRITATLHASLGPTAFHTASTRGALAGGEATLARLRGLLTPPEPPAACE